MTTLFSSYSDNMARPGKKLWEDPCLTLERSLVARGQEGGDPEESWSLEHMLGPLGTSGDLGNCA